MTPTAPEMTAVTLARQARALRWDSLPADVQARAKWLLLDQLGCMIAGGQTWQAHQLTDHLVAQEKEGAATVFGQTHKLTVAAAAHGNAHAASVFSLDDSLIRFGHPGCSIIPAALADAEARGASGKELLTAIVTGYEISLRIGKSLVGTPERELQVKGNATWQVFGSVAALTSLRGLDETTGADAFGIAAIHAPVPFIRKFHSKPMNWLKNNYGWACRAGVAAVDLAQAGFNGNRAIFDGEEGFWVMAGSDRNQTDWFTKDFGSLFLTRDVGFKPYGVCRWIHTAVDCTRELIAAHDLRAEDVAGIHVATVGEFVRDFGGPWPKGTLEGVFHIPYALALEFFDRSSAKGLHEVDLDNGAMRAFGEQITLSALPGADERFYGQGLLPVAIEITLQGGRKVACEAEIPRGDPRGPAYGFADVSEKFQGLVEGVYGAETVGRLIGLLGDFENHHVSDLSTLLSAKDA